LDQPSIAHVSVLIGVNNLSSDSPENIALGIKTVVETIHQKLPRAQIILNALFPVGKESSDPRRAQVAKVNQLIKPISNKSYVYWNDLTAEFLLADGSADLTKMAGDALHLGPKGYEAWSVYLLSLIETIN
jgi:lysophospholipase L1-like esterase